MPQKISSICISAKYEDEIIYVSDLIKESSPNTKIVNFDDVMIDLKLLEKCDFIFICGGDGSVAYLVGKFFEKYGEKNLKKLKPLVPVIRPKSVGYLKQLDFDRKKFMRGFKKLVNKKYNTLQRTVLTTTLYGKDYLAVNEIFLTGSPHMSKFEVFVNYNKKYAKKYTKMTTTMADGVFVVTPIGSTGWALSYGGQIILDEDSLELTFAGGVHSSANFTLPRTKIKIEMELKNSSIMPETVNAYHDARRRLGMIIHENSDKTLQLLYGPRVIIDGKLVAFGITYLEIKADNTIPFVILDRETTMDKARKLTKQQNVK